MLGYAERTMLGRISLVSLGFALGMPACSAPTPDYGVGNGLRSGDLPAAQDAANPADAGVSVPPGLLDAGCDAVCSVSWSTDIYPNMESTGPWQCANSACHGGTTPPLIEDGNPLGAYVDLATHEGTYSDPYIVPCDTDPADSSILCNLTANGCGVTMPIGSGTPLTASELTTIQTWVMCGSPFN